MIEDQSVSYLLPKTIDCSNNQKDHYIVQVSDIDYLKNLTGSSEGTLGTEEDDEDDLLRDDMSGWDIFDDYHKF